MIGQKELRTRIEQFIENGTFPRFSILVGPKGSGKKTLANWIRRCMGQNELTISYEATDVKIDTIRDIIAGAYKTAVTNIYIIPDADYMSNAAKNALLKVTEEPPNNAYFIMTLEDENNTLETIKSRGTVFHMDRYTPDEIASYFYEEYHANNGKPEEEIIRAICETPGEVDLLSNIDNNNYIVDFYDYVKLVVDNIAEVSLANAFKIPSKVALKDDAEGYDLRLFWKAFMRVLMHKSLTFDCEAEQIIQYGNAVAVTSKYLQKLRVKGINRSMLMDNWVLEIRELWQN